MVECPQCGQPAEEDEMVCSACGRPVRGDTDDGNTDDTAGQYEYDGVSRREILTYGGGSALLTWAIAGVTWYLFFHTDHSPEETVVREYVDAIDRAKYNTARGMFHRDAPGEGWRPTEIPDVNRVAISVESTEVVDRQTDIPQESVQELALVLATITLDSGMNTQTIEVGFVVAKNQDGKWKLWEDR